MRRGVAGARVPAVRGRRASSLLLAVAGGAALLALASPAGAQGTAADYKRAADLNARYRGLAVDVMSPPQWIQGTERFYYDKTVRGGHAFVLVDAEARTKVPAFDHARLATTLSTLWDTTYTAVTLPFTRFDFRHGQDTLRFLHQGHDWDCSLSTYECRDVGPARFGRFGRGGPAVTGPYAAGTVVGADPSDPRATPGTDPGPHAVPYVSDADPTPYAAPYVSDTDPTPYEGPWHTEWTAEEEAQARRTATIGSRPSTSVRSPDGRLEAYIWNYNVWVRPARPVGAADPAGGKALSWDGSEGDYYSLRSIVWSPDSRHLVAYRDVPGYERHVHYVVSNPPGQLQPEDSVSYLYRKPGDRLDVRTPVLFDVEAGTEIQVSDSLFPNAYDISPADWWQDGRAFTFEYNQRGHQVYRVVEVDAKTGAARALVTETSNTFIDYPRANGGLSDTGHTYRYDLHDGARMIWMSERDGWAHLYMIDDATGRVDHRITKGDWVVRDVEWVDTVQQQIYFGAGGVNPGEDPYFMHYYRIDFDGSNLIPLTPGDGYHDVVWSPDHEYYVDISSRVDLPTQGVLRRTSDQSVVMDLEKGDITALEKVGWKPPQVFVAKGRDGKTDIYGAIFRPTNFNPKKKYRVIENIYAGPQGSFVPKTFRVTDGMRNLAELGFVVVQIDGMGTNNRSKAFHDVAWKDLKDAGFPDRILWHEAAAKRFPWYDISKGVGIYGTSAGGQNAMAALLFHPDFYTVGYSASGCHDNRMDKIWWNELWMGWPVGPQYVASSNMENAYRLQGKLMLVFGELDTNVDPSSTLQVVNALIKDDKMFDLLEIPNSNHTSGGPYGYEKRDDFFVHNLLGVEPPNRNAFEKLSANRIIH
jgi:dipeptidyl aminopeptidase/acylaminoacyl peptidase